MDRKAWIGGALAGVAVFLWGMVSHMALPLGEAGFSQVADEVAFLDALKRQVPTGGLYIFPAEGDPAQWEAMYRDHPHGILAIAPAGSPLAFGRRLGFELATNVVGGWLAAAFLVATLGAAADWRRGLLVGAVLGAFASVATDLSYWIWYDFPIVYTLAQLAIQVSGWAVGGAVLGWWLGRR